MLFIIKVFIILFIIRQWEQGTPWQFSNNMQIKLDKYIPTSFDHKFIPNISTIQHYFGKAGRLLGIPMEARNGFSHLRLIMWMGGVGKYNKFKTNILVSSGIHKNTSNYPTCSFNNLVKLRWQTKLRMALNGLTSKMFACANEAEK